MNSFWTSYVWRISMKNLSLISHNVGLISTTTNTTSTTTRIHEFTVFYNCHEAGLEVSMFKGSTTAFYVCIVSETYVNGCLAK
jgi:membrane-bound inhibitor of C-type lysozyme